MAITPEHQKTAKTWQTMVDSNKALLLRKTGHDVAYWARQARTAGLKNDAELRHWMRDEHGVTGYAQYAVSWELFGYPEFMLRDADELIDGQYINHAELRPIADALLAWAAATEGVEIQMRKGYVSLHSPRRTGHPGQGAGPEHLTQRPPSKSPERCRVAGNFQRPRTFPANWAI